MSQRGKLRIAGDIVLFWCPGCNSAHAVRVQGDGPGPKWEFNGDYDAPTFKPSVLVTYDGPDAGKGDAPPARCHSYVTDGLVQFLPDSTHAMAGQTVPIGDFDPDYHT